MTKALTLIAINQIIRTVEPGVPGDKSKGIKATPPKTQVIQPKTIFVAQDETEFNELTEGPAPAARAPEKDEKVEVSIENVLPADEAAAKEQAKKDAAAAKAEAAKNKPAAAKAGAKTTEAGAGSTKTSASTGTTTSGSKAAGAEGAGDGSDLV